jgi:hypothetical protein
MTRLFSFSPLELFTQYFDEVVHLGSSEETLEMSPWIGPSARDDPLLGMDHRLGMIDGSDDILDSDGFLGSEWIIGSG